MRYCPRCGAKNTSGDPICRRCGQKLYGLLVGAEQEACRACGTANPANADFCVGCGRPGGGRARRRASVAAAAAAAAAPSPPPAAAAPPPPLPAPVVESDEVSGRTTGCLVAALVAALVIVGAALALRPTSQSVAVARPAATEVAVDEERAPRRGGTGSGLANGAIVSGPVLTPLARRTAEARAPAETGGATPVGAGPIAPGPTAPTSGVTIATAPAGDRLQPAARLGGLGAASATAEAAPSAGAASGRPPAASAAEPPGAAATGTPRPADGTPVAGAAGTTGGAFPVATGAVATSAAATATSAAATATSAAAAATSAAAVATAAARSTSADASARPGPPGGSLLDRSAGVVGTPVDVPTESGSMIFLLSRIDEDVLTPLPGRRRLTLTAAIDNVGTGPLPYDGGAFTLIDGSGTSYAPLPVTRGSIGAGVLPSGGQVAGQVGFEIPSGRDDLTLRYQGAVVVLTGHLPPARG